MFTDDQLERLEELRERQYQLDVKRQWLIARLFLVDLLALAWARYEDVEVDERELTDKEEWRARGEARRALLRQSEQASGSVALSKQ